MSFAKAMTEESRKTLTENGAEALNSTGNACLDLFGTIGSLRDADENRIGKLFAEAYRQDPLRAVKIAFYSRDIRGGLGERRVFRTLLRYMAKYHPEALAANLDLIGVYGRYDDIYSLIGTSLEDKMWTAMKNQFEEDRKNLEAGNAVSLLAKWIKTPDASSPYTRKLGILTAEKLGYSVYDFKRILRAMRRHLRIVESFMSAGRWDEIKYSAVPSRAMLLYRKAFLRRDEERYKKFVEDAVAGRETIHSGDLYPYDLVLKVLYGEYDDTVEAQWRQLPDYIKPGQNVIVVADVSGSMTCSEFRPLATSIGLALYFAERNTGAYHNLFMTFSESPTICAVEGETLQQKVSFLSNADWGYNTDLEAVFIKILKMAVDNKVPSEEMPVSIVIVSDMEIDNADRTESGRTFYDSMEKYFADSGYTIPNLVFWNVESRHNVFHADAYRKGVQLCSGQSPSTFKHLVESIGMTPTEMMLRVIDSERYSAITIAE